MIVANEGKTESNEEKQFTIPTIKNALPCRMICCLLSTAFFSDQWAGERDMSSNVSLIPFNRSFSRSGVFCREWVVWRGKRNEARRAGERHSEER